MIHRQNVTTGEATDYLRLGSRTVARLATTGGSTSTTWTYGDHLGSPVAAANASGTLLWREDYTPYGEARQQPAANDNGESFTTHITDTDTGLVYMQARYYDPAIGRFLSQDPVGFAQGGPGYFNRYAYVGNDPVNHTDPSGMVRQDRQQAQNPVDGGRMRNDGAGRGNYGAARGNREHNGVDIRVNAGDNVLAPIDGTVRVITAIYPNDTPDFDGVEITNSDDNQSVKLFYVDPSVDTGDAVLQGDVIGTAQDVGGHYGGDMQNHVHMEHRIDGAVVNPNDDLDLDDD